MRTKVAIGIFLSLIACSTVEDERICLDWGSFPVEEEKCTPLYGGMVCVTELSTRYWCKLYEEEQNG